MPDNPQRNDERIASPDEVLQALTRVLRREESDQAVVREKEKTPVVDENGKRAFAQRETQQVVALKPKISDMTRAAELLGKRYGLYTDKVAVTGALPVIVDDIEGGNG